MDGRRVNLWDDELGEIHDIQQGEGGEEGDAPMPMLLSLGLHEALVAVARQLTADEELFAFLDDIYVICSPERVGDIHFLLQQELWRHSRISLHLGKTQGWSRAGFEPPACAELQQAAEEADSDAVVWKESQEMPRAQRGVKILGTPVCDPEYVKAMLSRKTEEYRVFLEHIPNVDDLQSAWLLLLFCASTRANYLIRNVQPELVVEFAQRHEARIWQRLCEITGIDEGTVLASSRQVASLPLSMRGLELRSAQRTSVAAHWASWADAVGMIQNRHPTVAATIVRALENGSPILAITAVVGCIAALEGASFRVLDWESLLEGLRPPPVSQEGVEEEPNHQHGWQKLAARSLEIQHLSDTWSTLTPTDQAMLRSQGGPLAAVPFLALPTSRLTKLDPPVFRTLLLRRLRLPLPLTMLACGCGRLLDAFGRRGFALESAMVRICREGGARVMTNVLVRDLDLNLHDHVDARRLDIVADGLPLFGGVQLASDTTLVSAVRQDGTPRPGATVRDGVALREARRRKERVYPGKTGVGGRAPLGGHRRRGRRVWVV